MPQRTPKVDLSPRTVNIPEACLMLNVSRNHLYKLMANAVIKGVQYGNRIRIPMAEIERLTSPETNTAARYNTPKVQS